MSGSLIASAAFAQTPVPFEPGAWYAALSEQYHNNFIQVQVGKAPEGAVVKAIFEDSLTAAMPLDQQEDAARAVARYVLSRATAQPRIALIVVGWRHQVGGIPMSQTFRFLATDLTERPPSAKL